MEPGLTWDIHSFQLYFVSRGLQLTTSAVQNEKPVRAMPCFRPLVPTEFTYLCWQFTINLSGERLLLQKKIYPPSSTSPTSTVS